MSSAKRTSNPDFLNGVPELLILGFLARRPMYGYELVQAIQAETGQTLSFGEGCIYPILHRLEHERLLAGRRESVGGRSRVVYRVTEAGQKRLDASSQRWSSVVRAVAQALWGESHGRPAMA